MLPVGGCLVGGWPVGGDPLELPYRELISRFGRGAPGAPASLRLGGCLARRFSMTVGGYPLVAGAATAIFDWRFASIRWRLHTIFNSESSSSTRVVSHVSLFFRITFRFWQCLWLLKRCLDNIAFLFEPSLQHPQRFVCSVSWQSIQRWPVVKRLVGLRDSQPRLSVVSVVSCIVCCYCSLQHGRADGAATLSAASVVSRYFRRRTYGVVL